MSSPHLCRQLAFNLRFDGELVDDAGEEEEELSLGEGLAQALALPWKSKQVLGPQIPPMEKGMR